MVVDDRLARFIESCEGLDMLRERAREHQRLLQSNRLISHGGVGRGRLCPLAYRQKLSEGVFNFNTIHMMMMSPSL